MKNLRHWLVFLACCLIAAAGLGMLLNTSGIFIAPVAEELGVGRGAVAAWLTVFSVVMAIVTPLAGTLYARVDARWLAAAGIILAAGSVAAMSQFTALWQWYAAGVVFGFGGALSFFVAVPTIINNWFVKKRGLLLGIAMACTGLGGAIGGPIVQAVLSASGWRTAYLAVGAASILLAVPITVAVVRSRPSDVGLRPFGVAAHAPLGQTSGKATSSAQVSAGRPPDTASAPATTSSGHLPGPSFQQVRSSASYWLLFGGILLIGLGAAYLMHLPGFALSIGRTAEFGAVLGSAMLLGNVGGKVALGVAGDKLGSRTTTMTGVVLVALGFALLFLGTAVNVLLFTGAFLIGLTQSMAAVSAPMLVGDLFGQRDFSRKLSYVSAAVSLAQAIGAVAVGTTYDLTGSYAPAMAGGLVVALAGGALVLMAYAKRVTVPSH